MINYHLYNIIFSNLPLSVIAVCCADRSTFKAVSRNNYKLLFNFQILSKYFFENVAEIDLEFTGARKTLNT